MIKTFKLFVFLFTPLFLIATPVLASPPLGDLTIPPSRVPDWYMPPDPPDMSNWTIVPVHAANCNGSSATNDQVAIQNAINAAGPNAIIQLDGTPSSPCVYNLMSGNVTINKSTLVLRGGGMAATNIHLHSAGQNVSLNGPTSDGNAINWTAGYTRGTTVVTVASTAGIVVGDWIYLNAAFPAELGVGSSCPPLGSLLSARNHAIEKVTAVDGTAHTITFDHPLRNDFSNAASCQQTAAEMHPISRSGIESLTLTVVEPGNAGWFYNSPTNVDNTVESWIKDVKYIGGLGAQNTNGLNRFIRFSKNARFLFSQIWLSKIFYWKFDGGAIDFNWSSYESAVVDSIFEATHVDTRIMGGASGIVWAYNFSRCAGAGSYSDGCEERSTFLHGLAHEILQEGNDFEVMSEWDNHWGPQQYRNTWYRNRATTNPYGRLTGYSPTLHRAGFSSFCEVGARPLVPLANFMLNTAARFGNNGAYTFDCATTPPNNEYWIERNLVEGTTLNLTPQADTHNISNVVGANTTQGVGDWGTKNFPASLVYTSKPSWWTISSPWPAIGADVDVIGGTMHKLPAQCRYEGSTTGDCAPAGSPPTPTDNPPSFSSFSISPTTVNVNASVTFSATVTDDHGISGVQFYVGGVAQGAEVTTGTGGTYTLSYSPLVAGTYSITARVRDTANQLTTSNPVTLTVNPVTPPPLPSGCTTSTAIWQNTSFASQSGVFTSEFDVTPIQAGLDAVTALSTSAGTAYTSFAILIRFGGASNQYIETINGSVYGATNPMTYTIGTTYHFRVVVNPTTHLYSVYVKPAGGIEQTLATNFAFRDGQTNTSSFANLGIISEPGSHQVCNFAVTSTPPAGSISSLSLTTPTLDINNLSSVGRSFSVSFYTPGQTPPLTPLSTSLVTGTSLSITFTPAGLPPGTYDVRVKRDGSLYRKKSNLSLTNGTSLGIFPPLISGDLNSDNSINALDWSMMSPDWFQTGKSSDINGDGITNALDFTWLNRNWFLIGE